MKKRITSIVLTICMIFSMIAIPAHAAGECLVANKTSLNVGDTFILTYTIPNSVSGVDSIVIEIGFDNTKFEATEIVYANINPLERDTNHTVSQANTNGKFRGEWSSNDDTFEVATTDSNLKLVEASFTVKENAVAGDADFTVNVLEIADEYASDLCSNAGATRTKATVSIADSAPGGETPTDDYTATIANASTDSTIRVGDTITVNIGANKVHSASKMTLTYDSNLVTFVSATGCTVNSGTAGTLELASYGAEKKTTDYYVLTFTATANGTAAFEISNAKFGTGDSSETASLEDATEPAALNVTIEKKQYSVTLNQYNGVDIFSGNAVATDGETYTFKPETTTGAHYNYTLTSVTMNSVDVLSSVNGDATNGWSITGVNGPLVISGTRTGKPQTVTINTVFGEETTTQTTTATYGTPYTFTVPADETIEGTFYSYALSSVKIGGENYTGHSAAEGTKTYTIPGDAITGVIEITITKSNKFNVAISGEGAGQVTADPVQVAPGGDVTLTLTPEAGYTYVIKVNGNEVTLDSNNQCTITGVQSAEDVKVTVDKSLTMTYASVSNYLQVDGSLFWLVKIAPTDPATDTSAQIADHTYTYNGANMYWSSAYNAYVTLVVAETAPTLAVGDFAIVAVDNIPAITYDMNVNESTDGTVDPADAQLVWNMYTVKYNNFTKNVTMEKFLKADVDGNGKVDVDDAADIISSSYVLNLSETTN